MDKTIATKDFRNTTLRALARKGIKVVGIQMIPDMSTSLPWANASCAYVVDDNGTGKVWTHAQVINAAQ